MPKLLAGVCYQRLERAFVCHRDHPTLNSPAQQVFGQTLTFRIRQIPAPRLGVDVGEQLGQRFEFDEAMNGKGDRVALFENYGGGSHDFLKRNLLCPQGRSQERSGECNLHNKSEYSLSLSHEHLSSRLRPLAVQ